MVPKTTKSLTFHFLGSIQTGRRTISTAFPRRLEGLVVLEGKTPLGKEAELRSWLHPFLPLLLWWGVEHFAESDREAALQLLEDRELWRERLVQEHLLSRWMRRYAQAGGLQNLQSCARLL